MRFAIRCARRQKAVKVGAAPRARPKTAAELALMPPHGDAAASTLVYSAAGALLNWGYFNPGDYDQNGVVGLSDLVPLAVHFGESSGTGSLFPENSIGAVLDGDGNGELNLADIIAIAVNFGVKVEAYRVFTAGNASACPALPDDPNGVGAVFIGAVAFGTGEEPPGGGRKGFSCQVVPTATTQYYWVRPFDGETGGAASNYVVVELPPKQGPIAQLAYPPSAETLAHIVWNASVSFDPDGVIRRYEWDFNNDGVYEYDSGDVPTADFYYYAPGDYTCTVRVTDNDFNTATASGSVTVTEKARWHDTVVEGCVAPATGSPALAAVSVLDAGGVPGVVYNWPRDEVDPVTHGAYGVRYVRGLDAHGLAWAEPVFLGGCGPPSALEGFQGAAAIVDGNPAVAYTYSQRDDFGTVLDSFLVYQAALDPAGASWASQVVVDSLGGPSGSYAPPTTLCFVAGRPVIANLTSGYYVLGYVPAGGNWPHPWDISFSSGDWLTSVASLPAYVTRVNESDILYMRAIDQNALQWAEPMLVDSFEQVGDYPRLLDLSGLPAVLYFDDSSDSLRCRTATDSDGTQWHEPVVIDVRANGFQISGLVDGRPAVMYKDRISRKLRFAAANDSSGARWGFPVDVPAVDPTEADGAYTSERQTAPRQVCDVAGLPALAFVHQELVPAPGTYAYELHYLAYY